MDTKKQSFLRHFNLYYFKFGTKLFLVFLALLVTSLFVTAIIEATLLKSYDKEVKQEKLAQITGIKKEMIEEKFIGFQKDFEELVRSDDRFKSGVAELITASKNLNPDDYNGGIQQYKKQLKEYYLDEILSGISWNKPELKDIFPKTKKEILLQYLYIAKNPHPKGEKDKLLIDEENTSYSYAHSDLHPIAKKIARTYKLNNLYLVDCKTGVIFYNLNKNITLASNLFTGPYSHSHLATTFQKSLADVTNSMIVTDYSHFIPDYNKAVGFIAMPVIQNGEKKAIAIAEVNSDFFLDFFLDEWMLDEQQPLSINLVGKDNLLRTSVVQQIRDQEKYFTELNKKEKWNKSYQKAIKLNSVLLTLGYSSDIETKGSLITSAKDYAGNKVNLFSLPLNLKELDWSVVVQNDIRKNQSFYKKLISVFFLATFCIFLLAIYLIHLLNKSITKRLKVLDNAMNKVAHGELPPNVSSKWHDEIGHTIDEFKKLQERITLAGDFAFQLSEGNFSHDFESKSENDKFAEGLNTLNQKLRIQKAEAEKRDEEDKIQTWINDGIAKFNDLLRQSNDNINQLSYIIIENLIDYLEANQGGVFLVEGEREEEKIIKLTASFAYDRRKFHTKTIEIGEGLIGNCYLEKKPILLKKIPQDYIEITSGLGKATPTVLYIVPLSMDKQILGFVEIASFEDIKEYKIQFINKLAENIAATFSTVKLNTRTAELLEESKKRANEIAQQEEEMRQNLEEMQATQEELARLRDEDERKSQKQAAEIEASYKMIRQLMNSISGEVLLSDSKGNVVLANKEAATRFNTTPEKIMGVSFSNIFPPEKAERECELDQIALREGAYSEESVELIEDKEVTYSVFKKQFFLPIRKETGVLTTRIKRL